MVQRVVTVNDVLDGHVALDIECLDRIYLNAYVPILQTSSQVVAFLSGHLGFPFPSPALFRQMGDRFRKAVLSFSDANDIPWVKFEKDEAKLEVMQPHLARQAATGRSGGTAIGVAQGPSTCSSSGGCTGCHCRSARRTMMPATGGRPRCGQVEISRTIVFDAPRHARGFFEALVADNLDIGRPHNVEIIFARK